MKLEPRRLSVAEMEDAWRVFDRLVSNGALEVIPRLRAVEWPYDVSKEDALKCVRADRIMKIVYDRNEDNLTKFNSLLAAVHSSESAVFLLLNGLEDRTEIYLGVNVGSVDSILTSLPTMEGALHGNFPGIAFDASDMDCVRRLSSVIRESQCVSCVTGLPSRKEDDQKSFAQGLEKLIDAMGKRHYMALLLATPVPGEQIAEAESAYQSLYSQLSRLNVNQMSLTNQQSTALSKSVGTSFSTALSESLARTNTTTQTTTKSTSRSNSKSFSVTESENTSKTTNAGGALAGLGAAVGASFGGVLGAMIGGGIGGFIGGFLGSKTEGTSRSENSGEINSQTDTDARAEGFSMGETSQKGTITTDGKNQTDSETKTALQGISYSYAIVEKHVVESQKLLDEQLARMRKARNYGGWNYAAYFLGKDNETTGLGANVLAGLLRGEGSGIEHFTIQQWSSDDKNVSAVREALSTFRHPVFEAVDGSRYSPTSLVTTPELTVGMSLPQKSLPGLPVFEMAEFGRAVLSRSLRASAEEPRAFHFGHIVHLDRDYPQPVDLDLDSLTSHVFITGSTGAGKSNAIYSLLGSLYKYKNNIPFLVIEPAKGEYKQVFGGLSKVHVYGTNPYQSELLRINPFAFPEGIHIIEHIDRLIEILNAAWPMYSAMPAILKEAVEKTYEKFGWNLLSSRCEGGKRVFPDFTDLMETLPQVIDSSDYSAEVIGNYKGALLKRVGSLTNGYYRSIFQKDELSAEKLCDESVIVDLSRVSASETKALLMGVLFQRLQEHRIAQKAAPANSRLKHVTVLEEAHHLLRKTSTAQGDEAANLAGKSIEMLTNAIAEMRTYGEGFVIADQAPGLLDPSVIRNTNTKIVFNLPDFEDRALVGKAQGLRDEQIDELAHLRRGHASVYQNHWQEAVLCHVDHFEPGRLTNMGHQEFTFESPAPESLETAPRTKAEALAVELLLTKAAKSPGEGTNSAFPEKLDQLRRQFPRIAKCCENGREDDILACLNHLVVKQKIEENIVTVDWQFWTRSLLRAVFSDERVCGLSDELKDVMLKMVFRILSIYEKHANQRQAWLDAANDVTPWRIWK